MAEYPLPNPRKPINIGDRFGRLIVAGAGEPLHSSGRIFPRYLCQCDCGGTTLRRPEHLQKGSRQSCGCWKLEIMRVVRQTHGMTGTSEHKIWQGIISRPDKNYGERGIKVCDRWRNSFEAFYADMGPRPSRRHSIDRINNDGNYEPANCRWATVPVQSRNRRTNRLVTYQGCRMVLEDAAALAGIGRATVAARLARGWSEAEALARPTAGNGRKGVPKPKRSVRTG